MARYIDADKLIADGWRLERHGISNKLLQVMSIADVPTSDVVEVKCGEWIEDFAKQTTVGLTGKQIIIYKCSRCGRYEPRKEPYCHCGAKMDGGKAE